MKKLFAILMSVLMIACFMPSMAFAESGNNMPEANNGLITLTDNVVLTSTYDVTSNTTINLAGYTITGKNCRAIQVKSGTLTLTGSGMITSTKETGDTSFSLSSSVIRVGDSNEKANWSTEMGTDAGLVVGKDVEIQAPASYGITAFGDKTVESVTIYGTVRSTATTNTNYDGCAVATNGNDSNTPATIVIKQGAEISAEDTNGIYMPAGNLTVEGGEITGTTGIYFKSANLTISGGTITGTGTKYAYTYHGNGGKSTGDAVVIDNCGYPGGIGAVSITGGTFSSTSANAVGSYYENTETKAKTAFITGGTFTSDPSAYLEDNRIVCFENDQYKVEPFDAKKAGITLAPLVDRSAYPITDLEEDYEMIWDGENVAINFKPQLHTNGESKLGKWVGIAVPVPEGAKTVDYKYSDKDIVKGVSLEGEVWKDATGKKFISFYWDYATRFVTSLSYKFDNEGNTNTVKITVNGYPTEIIKAPLHDKSGSIADSNLYSKYEIDPEAGAAIITVKGLKAHENASGDKGRWVGIAVPADYKTTDTKLIYRYKDGDKGTWGSWKTAELKSEVWEKDGKKYVSFYMDSEKVSVRWISYSFGTLTAEDANKDGVEVAGANDVRIEVKVENVSSGGGSSSSTTTTTDNVTSTTGDKTGSTTASTTATVKSETKTNADGTKTTTATVDTTTAADIVKKTVENKSEEVVVNTTTTTAQAVTETAAGTKTEVALPEQTVKSIANETEAAVTIKSDAAEVKLDKEAVKAVAEQAGDTGTVSLVVETVAQSETKVEVDLKLVTSKGNVTEFKGGSVSVTVKLNAALAAKPVVCVYIDNFGTYHKVSGQKNADGTYTFVTGHFSSYAVMAEDDADKVIAEQTENVEKLVSTLSLKARSQKTEKGSIRVTLNVDEDAIRQIEDLGYTVKYKFYRSTKKAASYKAKYEKAGLTYTNTAGTKGTRYYYKARVMVYDAQGALIAKTALTQCKYACRIR